MAKTKKEALAIVFVAADATSYYSVGNMVNCGRRLIMEDKKKIAAGELENISGGQKVYNYYHKQIFCRECGSEDFTCLGWKEKPNGNCTAGYEFKCNGCGYTLMVYYN